MRYILSLVLAVLLATPALAADSQPEAAGETTGGGFDGPVRGERVEQVANAVKLGQDTRVTLEGNIVEKVADGKNLYFFKDDSGEMRVAIPPKQFRDNRVNPQTKVRLTGKIDKPAAGQEGAVRLKVSKLEIIK